MILGNCAPNRRNSLIKGQRNDAINTNSMSTAFAPHNPYDAHRLLHLLWEQGVECSNLLLTIVAFEVPNLVEVSEVLNL